MRVEKDNFFMNIAKEYSEQSTCVRRHVGAVLTKGGVQIGGGYNGAVKGRPHCTKETCLRIKHNIPSGERQEMCIGAHAEANAIVQAGKLGINLEGATLYCTTYPCSYCAKLIVNAGIVRVIYSDGYPDPLTEDILSNIIVEKK